MGGERGRKELTANCANCNGEICELPRVLLVSRLTIVESLSAAATSAAVACLPPTVVDSDSR